jgi:hypothetical protein
MPATACWNTSFGVEWLRDHVLVGCRYSGYLTMNPIIQADGMGIDKDHTLKVLELAELLYNLQGVPGLDHCLDRRNCLRRELAPELPEEGAEAAPQRSARHYLR